MNIAGFVFVFLATFLVDTIPFVGPPAWTVMVFFQLKYGLNIWSVIIIGVIGSALGRYVYSVYIPLLSAKMINARKNEDVKFIGGKLNNKGWQVQTFVVLYTLMPLPSTPLFTASGMAGVKASKIIPAFLVGKFFSDAVMVFAGDYVVKNADNILSGMVSWKNFAFMFLSLILVLGFLFIDWRTLLQEKKFRIRFNIWR